MLVTAAFWLEACAFYHPATGQSSQQVEPIPASAWPMPPADQLDSVIEKTPAVAQPIGHDTLTEIKVRRLSTGLLRLYPETDPEAREPVMWDDMLGRDLSAFVDVPRDGSFLDGWEIERAQIKNAAFRAIIRRLEIKHSPTKGRQITTVIEHDPGFLKEGIPFTLPWCIPEDPRGIVLHIEGTNITKYEVRLTGKLEQAGWAVARINAPNTVQSRRSVEHSLRVLTTIEAGNTPGSGLYTGAIYPLEPGTDPEALGAEIARDVDRTIAVTAYTAEAVINEIDRHWPVLADKPIVVAGFSAGALPAPAVAARLRERDPGRLRGLLLVGGGGDLLTISQTSTFSDGGISLHDLDEKSPIRAERFAALREAYLRSTRLDPLRSIAALRDLPVLHIFGTLDSAVPTSAARRLDKAHGAVDEIRFFGGHGLLFYFLPTHSRRIIRWLDSIAPRDLSELPQNRFQKPIESISDA